MKSLVRPLLTTVVVLVLMIGAVQFFKNSDPRSESPVTQEPVHLPLHVEVGGAVIQPGSYDLREDSRIYHAIYAAGGFAPGANTADINLAAHLYNGQHLEIPFLKQVETPILLSSTPTILLNAKGPTATAGGEPTVVATAVSMPISEECLNPVIGSGVFVWPTDAHHLLGKDFSSEHPGIDLAAGLGLPVYAADSGMVRTIANDSSGYGNMLEIDHGNGYSTFYAHLNTFEVGMCQNIKAGQRIGTAGATGNADGVYLHFSVIQNGVYIDPWSALPEP